jgi:hypothetical protein
MREYEAYLKSQWWWDLKYKLITCNSSAECFICHKRTQLLLHHAQYEAKYHEKLNKDVYILCFDCHTMTHFWFFRLIKVPLKINALLFSMRMRKVIHYLKNGRLGLAVGWFLLTVIIGSWFLSVWLLSLVFRWGIDLTLKLVLK